MKSRTGTRFAPPAELYHRAAVLQLRADEIALRRYSRRAQRIGRDVARGVERIADAQVDARRRS